MIPHAHVNAVALAMPGTIARLQAEFDRLLGDGQHELLLLVGAGNVVQYAANVERKAGVEMLRNLLARWSLGMDDLLPDETTPGDLKAFIWLLDSFERACRQGDPASADQRNQLLDYVGPLIAKAKRT